MANNPHDHETTPPPVSGPVTPELSVIEGLYDGERYQDVAFELPEKNFVQTETGFPEVNDQTRLVYTLRQLRTNFPDLQYPQGHERDKKISATRRFLGQTALVANPRREEDPKNYNEPHKVKVTRRDYTEEALEGVMASLEEENHPTYQILAQIGGQFAEDLPESTLHRLKRDVIFAAHNKQFRQQVSDRVNRDRQVD
ncbi:MAG: hypothetical protein U5L95_04325 [Candidatus Saccharibacteria bacterium]|nr:hypothetical protein [Candidatus Saccharibacteria bacterium]